MTLKELYWKNPKKIRRSTWGPNDYLEVKEWVYNGAEENYTPTLSALAPSGRLFIEGLIGPTIWGVYSGHKGTDWEIVE